MNTRIVTKNIHAFLDYPVAALLIGAPLLFSLGDSHPAALWLSVVTGVAALVLTILTDHRTGLIRVVPYPVHVAIDGVVGIVFGIAPFVLGFDGIDAWYYWANALAIGTVVLLHKPEPSTPETVTH